MRLHLNILVIICVCCVSCIFCQGGNANLAAKTFNEGVEFENKNLLLEAELSYEEAVKLDSTLAEAHLNLGRIYATIHNDYETAFSHTLLSFEYSTSNLTRASSLNNMALFSLRLVPKSEENLKRILEMIHMALYWMPEMHNAIYNAGKVMTDLGDYDGAYEYYFRLKQMDPTSILATTGLGHLRFWVNDFLSAIPHYYDASRLAISSGTQVELTLNNLGQAARRLEKLSLACNAFRATTCWNKDNLWAIANAQATMRYSLGFESLADVDEMLIDKIIDDEGLPGTDLKSPLSPYFSLLIPWMPVNAEIANANKLCANHESTTSTRRQSSGQLHVGYLSYDFRKHSMGYLTYGYFIRHSLGIQRHILLALNDEILDHDQYLADEQLSPDILPYALSYGNDDLSIVSDRIKRQSYKFIDYSRLSSDYHVADAIEGLGLDILVDLMGYTTNSRPDIVGLKPAGIIVNYLGYPGTMGCGSHDYVILDKRTMPAETAIHQFTEKVVFLPHSYQVNEYLLDDVDQCLPGHSMVFSLNNDSFWHVKSTVPSMLTVIGGSNDCRDRISNSTQPLSSSSSSSRKPDIMLCNFNSNHKINPHDLDLWSSILLSSSSSSSISLTLHVTSRDEQDNEDDMISWLSDQCEPDSSLFECSSDPSVSQRLMSEFLSRGISIDNIRIAKTVDRSQHLHRLSGCDLFLDSLVYGAHTTAADSLWSGVPIISLWNGYGSSTSNGMFGRMPGRISSSLSSMAYDGSVLTSMQSVKEYEDETIRLMMMDDDLAVAIRPALLKYKLHESLLKFPLFNADVSTSILEKSYQAMKEIQHVNNEPMNIVIVPQMSHLSGYDYFRQVCVTAVEFLLKESMLRDQIIDLNKVRSILSLMLAANHEDMSALYLTALTDVHRLERDLNDTEDEDDFLVYLKSAGIMAISSRSYINDVNFWKNSLVINSKLSAELANFSYSNESSSRIVNYDIDLTGLETDSISSIAHGIISLNFADCAVSNSLSSLVTITHLMVQIQCAINKQAGFQANGDGKGLIRYFEQFSMHSGVQLCEMKSSSSFISVELLVNHQVPIPSLSRLYSILCTVSSSYSYNASFDHLQSVFGNYGIILTSDQDLNDLYSQSTTWINQYLGSLIGLDDGPSEFTKSKMMLHLRMSYSLLIEMDDWKVFQQSSSAFAYVGLHDTVYSNVVRYSMIQHVKNFQIPSINSIQSNRRQLRSRSLTNKIVAIMCSGLDDSWFPNWGPLTLEQGGLGGSEEAVVLLSRALANIGYLVEIYASPLVEDEGIDQYGVTWYQHYHYDPWNNPPDVFIAWRYQFYLALSPNLMEWNQVTPNGVTMNKNRNRSVCMYWLHDVFKSYEYHKDVLNLSDVILCQSLFHKSQLMEYMLSRTVIFGNGLDERYFVDGLNPSSQFIYASSPTRGLGHVLKQWPVIKRHIPDASLNIYYGFTKSVVKYGRSLMPNFDSWMDIIVKMMEQDGIHYIGMVSHKNLSIALANSSFILYPTDYPESSCITLMKAMAMGAIPITSRHVNSAVYDLTVGYDLGPSKPFQKGGNMSEFAIGWADSVIEAYSAEKRGELIKLRLEMKDRARAQFSWSKVARLFEAVAGL